MIILQLFRDLCFYPNSGITVCTWVSNPKKNTTTPFLAKHPSKSAKCPSPPPLGNPPSILVFCELPLSEHPNTHFSVNSQNIKVFHP